MKFNKKFYLPFQRVCDEAKERFSTIERAIFLFFTTTLILSVVYVLFWTNDTLMVTIPKNGGALIEGSVNSPGFINPLLAIRDSDRDLSSLIYSGLVRISPGGEIINDLAERYEIRENGTAYYFKIKDSAIFHDGTPVTADDVKFTVERAQDASVKSVKRANWEGVIVEKISDKEILFRLKQPYTPFILNTAMGILPSHIWSAVEAEQIPFSQLNISPIGSGPYKIRSIQKDGSGVPSAYVLESFKQYTLGRPYISKIIFKFYPNQEALLQAYNNNEIENMATVMPKIARELGNNGARVETAPLARVFGVFFNQNQQTIFAAPEVRDALEKAVDKNEIVNTVMLGFASAIDGPFPSDIAKLMVAVEPAKTVAATSTSSKTASASAEAVEILERAGWKFDDEKKVMVKKTKQQTHELAFTLTTSNAPELRETASILKTSWEKIGAKVEIKTHDPNDLNQNVIRPRKFDALLFGEIIGRDMDVFAFWHSSQRNDPGLNLAMYVNKDTDAILEEARMSADQDDRIAKYSKFYDILKREKPALFLYTPDFIYMVSPKIQGMALGQISISADRFSEVYKWYLETQKVWKVFLK